ncbi:PspA/IM30 family protein [Pseudobacillus badius]|uniref:PspA/IM30 family protein n=1 Tax=Bacillus badius TaxID=1455 RepID=UPI0007B06D09|nr:PspA/IM30 family protein [Bacillus badius]KZN98536.1 modulator protein [Bacillus badius]OCS83233.1 modulator protein [Bacillus badius]OVE51609.1 modulator protein [Bacillus badius]TDW02854.1 phage shock protein A (PspA) family protein [Bacillus badius]
MTSIFTKMKRTIEAELFDFVEQKEQKNPIAMLNQYLREAQRETEKTMKLLERQQLLKNEFERERREALRMQDKRLKQAALAAEAGEESLEEFARKEADVYKERADRLQQSELIVSEQIIKLEEKTEEMKHKLKDMNVRRLELMGRENAARAHHSMNKVLNEESGDHYPFGRFEELEQYIDNLEGKVNRKYEMSLMDARLAELERQSYKKEKHTQSM